MMYFIELSQFSAEDVAITKVLREQMGHRERNTTHWIEWRGDQSSTSFWPDVTLVNAARLNWRQLKSIVDACRSDTIVLTGRQDSMLSLPVLPFVEALSDLLQFMPGHNTWPTTAPYTQSRDPQSYSTRWADTTPMPVRARC